MNYFQLLYYIFLTRAPSKHDMEPVFTDSGVDYKKTDEIDGNGGAAIHIGTFLANEERFLETHSVHFFWPNWVKYTVPIGSIII